MGHPLRSDELRPGTLLQGRYRIDGTLGFGGMGIVYEATNTIIHKKVALKCLRPDMASSDRQVKLLLREARTAASLESPHIVQVVDFWQSEDGHVFMVMEHLEGRTLYDEIQQNGPLNLERTAAILRQVCTGLAVAHQRSVVHRDLKPDNILLVQQEDRSDFVKILDFGVSKLLSNPGESVSHLGQNGGRVGTPWYMAPEYILSPSKIDHRLDIYALGVIYFEMLTGKVPFDSKAWPELVLRVCSEAPPSLLAVIPSLPHAAEDLYLRLMNKDPEDRPSSSREIIASLDLLVGRPASQPPGANQLDAPTRRPGASSTRISTSSREHDLPLSAIFEPFDESRTSVASARLPAVKTNLLAELDEFVGRERALARLTQQLVHDQLSVVLLLGSGGSGKTRLASRFARTRIDDFDGGVWLCDLADIESIEEVTTVVAAALGVPLTETDPAKQLSHALAGRGRTFIILDGFERIATGIPALLASWCANAPSAQFLLTSRRRVDIPNATVVTLEGMPTEESISLFATRARAVQPSLVIPPERDKTIRKIVEQLDGMPLAIELCAARVRMLPPETLLDRLEHRLKLLRGGNPDGAIRHATLESTIAWSWDLLAEWEKATLAQCSVFRGGFSLLAAETVVDLSAWPNAPYVMDVVQSLLDNCLLKTAEPIPGHGRFSLNESVRQFAENKRRCEPKLNGPSPDADNPDSLTGCELRHAQYFASFGTDSFIESLHSHGGGTRFRTLSLDLANLHTASRQARGAGLVQCAGQAVMAALQVYVHVGPMPDGAELARGLSNIEGISPTLRGRLLAMEGRLLHLAGRLETALAALDEANDIAQSTGDFILRCIANTYRATLNVYQGNLEAAFEQANTVLRVSQSSGSRHQEGVALGLLAYLELRSGRGDEARRMYEKAIARHRETGDRRMEGVDIRNLGIVHKQQGRLRDARKCYEEALEVFWEIHSPRSEGICFESLGLLDAQEGDIHTAKEHLERALEIFQEVGLKPSEGNVRGNLGDLMIELGDEKKADKLLREAIDICDANFPPAAGTFRGSLGLLCARSGDFASASDLFSRGEEQLRGTWAFELGKLYCKQAEAYLLGGNRVAATVSFQQAEEVADELNVSAKSELAQAIASLRNRVS